MAPVSSIEAEQNRGEQVTMQRAEEEKKQEEPRAPGKKEGVAEYEKMSNVMRQTCVAVEEAVARLVAILCWSSRLHLAVPSCYVGGAGIHISTAIWEVVA